jgi:hypothetical protein
MGGALLKKWGLPEKRLSNDEYNRLKNELVNILHSQVHAFHRDVDYGDILRCYDTFGVAPAIKQKETHGDLDILVGVDSLEKDLGFNRRTYQDMLWDWRSERLNTSDFLERLSGHKPSVNSNVISFPYMGFQVDLTFVPLEDFYSSKNYNSWGDCSNLMGRVFHKMGLHFGHTGLSFWIRQGMFDNNVTWSDNDHIYEKVILTKNMEDICKIGGFDYSKWEAGFDTNEEVYRFVAESEYFKKELFAFENLNHINRVRNKKRPMYAAFVEWLETSNPDDSNEKEFLDKSTYALIYQKRFPHLQTAISKYYFEYNVTKCLKSKLNGRIIMDVLGTDDGRTVGQIMSEIKKKYTTMELIGKTESEIRVIIGDAAAYLAYSTHLMLQ